MAFRQHTYGSAEQPHDRHCSRLEDPLHLPSTATPSFMQPGPSEVRTGFAEVPRTRGENKVGLPTYRSLPVLRVYTFAVAAGRLSAIHQRSYPRSVNSFAQPSTAYSKTMAPLCTQLFSATVSAKWNPLFTHRPYFAMKTTNLTSLLSCNTTPRGGTNSSPPSSRVPAPMSFTRPLVTTKSLGQPPGNTESS